MLKKISQFSTSYPWLVVVAFILLSVFFAIQLPKAKLDAELKHQIPANMASRLNLERIEDIFGGTEVVVLALKSDDILSQDTLTQIKSLSNQVEDLDFVEQVNSPFSLQDIRGEDNQLIIEDAITEIPKNQQERELLRRRIKKNDLVYGTIISKDFKAASIIVIMKDKFNDKEVLTHLQNIVAKTPGKAKVYLAGLPIVRAEVSANMQHNLKRFIPIGLVIMLVFLYFCFRELQGVLLTLAVMIVAIIVAMGLIPLLGWKIQLITIILPVILLAITNDYAIHIIAIYQHKASLRPTASNKELITEVVEELGYPVIAAGLTTIIGLLCLLAHIIVPAKQLGVLAAIGNGLAILGSLFLVPALLVLLPKSNFTKKAEKRSLIDKLLAFIAKVVSLRPKMVLLLSIIIIVFIALGIPLLKVDTNPINYFSPNTEIAKADKLVNDYFGGATNISIVAKGDIQDPSIMNKINDLENKLEDNPDIGTVVAISKPIKEMNQVLHNDNEQYYQIPQSKNAIAQYFMLYSMSADLDKIVDFDYKYSQITARIPGNSSNQVKKVVTQIKSYIKKDKNSPFIIVGGYADIIANLVDSVVKGQSFSLLISLAVVALIVMLLFKSPTAGLLAITPLSLAIVSLFGLMGYFQIELNIVTALLSSIMIGVGIDYTIHFLWHYREEKKSKPSIEAAISTLKTVGKAIVFNALSVVFGFVVLVLSNFLPVKFFGFLIVISISTCLLGALIILPTICIVFEPRFLEPDLAEEVVDIQGLG